MCLCLRGHRPQRRAREARPRQQTLTIRLLAQAASVRPPASETEKQTNRTAMIRCCLCMRWHHTECVGIDNSDEVGFWPCPDCRNIAADMKLMREAVTTTMETTNATIRQLAYNINIISDTLSQRNFECERLLADNCDLRHKITLLTTENNDTRWGRLMRHKTLLVGDSVLKKIDEEKLNATKVDAVSGTTVKDVQHRLQAQTAKYENMIVCAGTNDCSDADIDEQRFEATYRDVVKSAKELVLDGRGVRISSIPPRNDSPMKNKRVTRANNAIKALSERMGVSYIDNGPSFKLEDGSVNDGYLAKDGLHLTVAGTNRLVRNLKLATKNDDVTKSDHSSVRQRHSKPVPGAGQHDERHHPRRDARASRSQRHAAASQHNEANRRAVTRSHSTYTAAVRQPRYDTDHYHEQRPTRVHGRQPTAHESRRQRTTHQRPSGQLDEDEWPVIGDWTTVHRKPDRRQPARHYEGATHAPFLLRRKRP